MKKRGLFRIQSEATKRLLLCGVNKVWLSLHFFSSLLCVNRLLDALCLSCWTDAAACQSLPCFYNLQRL